MDTIADLYQYYKKCKCKIATDTRKIIPESLFFCLKGANFDGNKFAKEALEKGAAYAVIDNPGFAIKDRTLLVNDTLEALQQLAVYHRNTLSIPVIGITGTNGKTTSKELLTAILQTHYQVLATEGNLNNHIGVPLTLLKIRQSHELAVIEMGANHPGEIETLCNIANPTMGLITNVGKGHIEGFGSLENVFETKTALYRHLCKNKGIAFVMHEQETLKTYATKLGVRTIAYSRQNEDNACFGELRESETTLAFTLHLTNQPPAIIQTRLFGSYNLDNALAASCIGSHLSVPLAKIKNALESYVPNNNRSQVHKTARNTLVLDLYNANPTSMHSAIRDFLQASSKLPKACILGDMLELGNTAGEEHKSIIELLVTEKTTPVFFVGEHFMQYANIFSSFHFFRSSKELLDYLNKANIKNHLLLLKGSRSIQLEKVVAAL